MFPPVGTCLFATLFQSVLATPAQTLTTEPFYKGLGSYTRKITTTSPLAQRYFNQGLAFMHGFNHGASIRSFKAAAVADPECAMAHWGLALASGPHINLPMVPPPAAELAWKELTLAKQYRSKASPVEQDLIAAMSTRYANPQPEDRSPLDQAYANAMRKVWQKYPNDPDVGVLFAEALMDLRPWDQWTPQGTAQPGTEEVIATLDAVLKLNIRHPLANHLYIHAVEASPHPERADAAADRLRKLQPGLAHNVHMPTHIDIRRGRWQKAVDDNAKAVAADAAYRKLAGPAKGFLPVYVMHNRHMLVWAAMMSGQSRLATDHIRKMMAELPADFLKEYGPMIEGIAAMPLEVMVRFGKWDEVLAEPEKYEDYMPFSKAFHHAARAIAYAAKGDTKSARVERAKYLLGATKVPKDESYGNNVATDVLSVVTQMVEGEILLREGKTDEGLASLRAAIAVEDTLRYDEPPAWLIPVRHSLGAALMQHGRFAEAESVYREDLKRLPENGWSLYGLSQAMRKQGRDTAEVRELETRFHKVWAKADLKITSSCMCLPGK